MPMPKALIACEESQAVTIQLREKGIEAYSCDLQPCSGGFPEWHLKQNVLPLLENEQWDLIVAFPPCTHLCVSGAAWFEQKQKDGRQQEGINFFMEFINNTKKQKRIAIENPIGIMSRLYRSPDQIIQPYQFGDPDQKATCLWLKGLPKLKPTKIVKPQIITLKNGQKVSKFHNDTFYLSSKVRSIIRSRTFPGIAQAMADQWGNIVLHPDRYIFNLDSFLTNL
jgi:hypothetical protein